MTDRDDLLKDLSITTTVTTVLLPVVKAIGVTLGADVALTALMSLTVTVADRAKDKYGPAFVEECRQRAERLASKVLSQKA